MMRFGNSECEHKLCLFTRKLHWVPLIMTLLIEIEDLSVSLYHLHNSEQCNPLIDLLEFVCLFVFLFLWFH